MAKRFEPEKQGNQFLQSLMGDKKIVPLDQDKKENEKVKNNPDTVNDVYRKKEEGAKKVGRKRESIEPKVRTSIAIDPTDLIKLKRLAYLQRKSVSNIIGDQVKRYIQYNQEELKNFDSLPMEVQIRIDNAK